VAISPGGERIAYVGVTEGRLLISTRSMDSMEFEEIPDAGGGIDPFFSPDGRSMGFIAESSGVMKRIDFDAMVRATDLGPTSFVGATWADDGYIYFAPLPADSTSAATSIHRFLPGSGDPEMVTSAEEGSGELHMWPEVLPGSKTLLYAAVPNFDFSSAEVRARSLETGQEKVLVPNGQLARYLRSGHLVYLQGDTLLASRFDPDKVETLGNPKAVLSGVMTNPDSGSAGFAVSHNGVLVYLPEIAGGSLSTIVAYNREGESRSLIAEPADYVNIRTSPDGTRTAVQIQEGPGLSNIEIHDIRRRTIQRVTSAAGMHLSPVWSPDGRWVYYVHLHESGKSSLKRIPTDGSGREELVHPTAGFAAPVDVSPDGRWVLMTSFSAGNIDLVLVPSEPGGETRPYLATDADESFARISPDGRFAAYVDDSMGRREVFIRSFPDPREVWRVSTEGGDAPAWGPGGREIIYTQGGEIMAVDLGEDAEPRPGTPRRLFSSGPWIAAPRGFRGVSLDVLPDGTVALLQPEGEMEAATRIHVITNWHRRLRELLP
jgi:Tol biopolymer transport system component